MYVPSTGRFLSRDPLPANRVELLYSVPGMRHYLGGAGARHPYAYAQSSPVVLVDPSGRVEVTIHSSCDRFKLTDEQKKKLKDAFDAICKKVSDKDKPCPGGGLGKCIQHWCGQGVVLSCVPDTSPLCTQTFPFIDVKVQQCAFGQDQTKLKGVKKCEPLRQTPDEEFPKAGIRLCMPRMTDEKSPCFKNLESVMFHELVHWCGFGASTEDELVAYACEKKCYNVDPPEGFPPVDPKKCCCPGEGS